MQVLPQNACQTRSRVSQASNSASEELLHEPKVHPASAPARGTSHAGEGSAAAPGSVPVELSANLDTSSGASHHDHVWLVDCQFDQTDSLGRSDWATNRVLATIEEIPRS